MSHKKTWLITGASRGMGADFAKAALAAGHAVVASGRDADRVSRALGRSIDLLAVKLDVTSRADAEAAVRAAVDRFGRIDVLVNNAAKLARALVAITEQEPPPRRFVAGADAIGTAEQKVADLKAQIDANRDLSTSLAFG
jgi:NAD(P)-dependent dehydrogenase (short-subunit alcohol dehydrogenase family)